MTEHWREESKTARNFKKSMRNHKVVEFPGFSFVSYIPDSKLKKQSLETLMSADKEVPPPPQALSIVKGHKKGQPSITENFENNCPSPNK